MVFWGECRARDCVRRRLLEVFPVALLPPRLTLEPSGGFGFRCRDTKAAPWWLSNKVFYRGRGEVPERTPLPVRFTERKADHVIPDCRLPLS